MFTNFSLSLGERILRNRKIRQNIVKFIAANEQDFSSEDLFELFSSFDVLEAASVKLEGKIETSTRRKFGIKIIVNKAEFEAGVKDLEDRTRKFDQRVEQTSCAGIIARVLADRESVLSHPLLQLIPSRHGQGGVTELS